MVDGAGILRKEKEKHTRWKENGKMIEGGKWSFYALFSGHFPHYYPPHGVSSAFMGEPCRFRTGQGVLDGASSLRGTLKGELVWCRGRLNIAPEEAEMAFFNLFWDSEHATHRLLTCFPSVLC